MAANYQRVADDLRERIGRREWAVGERIPPISDLQEQYDIPSLNTIREAQRILIQEGLLRAEQGRGVFVSAHPTATNDDGTVAAVKAIDEAMRLLKDVRRLLTTGAVS